MSKKKKIKRMEKFIDDSLGFLEDEIDIDELKKEFRNTIDETS